MVLVLLLVVAVCTSCSEKSDLEVANQDFLADAVPENIVLHKKYSMSVVPNYALSRDPGDDTQLTNGKSVDGHLWTDVEAVGWANVAQIELEFDLGGVYQISSLVTKTAVNSKSEVYLPRAVLVFGSQNGREFQYVGDLLESTDEDVSSVNKYKEVPLRLDSNIVADRIRIVIIPLGNFAFFDEIEIFGIAYSKSSEDKHRVAGKRSIESFKTELPVGNVLIRKYSARRSTWDLKSIADRYAERIDTVGSAIQVLGQQQEEYFRTWVPNENFRTTYPQNEFHKRVFGIQALAWQVDGLQSVRVWTDNRWKNLDLFMTPGPQVDSLSVSLGMHDVRSVSLNISSPVDTTLEIVVADLVPSILTGITIREVETTDSPASRSTTTVFKDASCDQSTCSINLYAGLTRKLWISVDSGSNPPDFYEGSIRVGGMEIPFAVKIFPVDISSTNMPSLTGWDYTESRYYGVTDHNVDDYVDMLSKYGVDIPWATPATLGIGEHAPSGAMTSPPNPAMAESWISRWKSADKYAFFLAVKNNFAGFEAGSVEFERAVGDWLRWWENWFRNQGIESKRIILLLVDEPRNQHHIDLFLTYQKVIDEVSPGMMLMTNPIFKNLADALPIIEKADIIVPQLSNNTKSALSKGVHLPESKTKTLWLYSVAENALAKDPYSFYRLQFWLVWKLGATGSAYWSFGDPGYESSWNQYLPGTPTSSPLFIDSHKVASTIHMEAISEGRLDFSYLTLLQQALVTHGSIIDLATRRSAREILDARTAGISDQYTSEDYAFDSPTIDRDSADNTRIRILKILESIDSDNTESN